MTDGTPTQPPGWYYATGDPLGTQRYWDGEVWQGNPVAPPAGQVGYTGVARPSHSYADWGTRVLASLIDGLLVVCLIVVVVALASVAAAVSEALGTLVGVVLAIPAIVGALYVLLWLPGVTGQSPGRRVMGYEIVSDHSGTYIGGGAFLGRELLGGLINNFCYIDYLWPLWDDKNQRLADKIVSSVAVRTDKGKLFPLFPSGKSR